MYNNNMNLNNKSLYQEGGSMKQDIVDPQIAGIINDIQVRLQVGESPQEVIMYMMQQGYPQEFISFAFEKIGYDPAAMVDLMQSVQMPQQTQQMLPRSQTKQLEETENSFQYGGSQDQKYIGLNLNSDVFKPMYIPLSNEKGNVLGAASLLASSMDDMFSNEMEDGVKKGSFRDLKTKKSRWDETKPEQYDYKVTLDPRDKNKYVPTKQDLYNNRLRTEDQFMNDVRENSRVNFNPQTGKYETLISDSKINTDLYGSDKTKADKFINDNPNLKSFFERFDPETLSLISQSQNYPQGSTLGISPTGEAKSYRTKDNPYYYETMMGINTLESEQQNPFGNLFKMQDGGSPFGQASTQDSLNVYNNAVQLQRFYDNLKPYVPQAAYLNNNKINKENNINLQTGYNSDRELSKLKRGGFAQNGMETNGVMLDEVVINPPINDPKIDKNLNFNNWYQRQMQRPGMQNIGNVSKFGVAGANLVNEMFAQGRYNNYDNLLRNTTMADNVFQTRFDPVNARGTWDTNTGLAEPDNLYPYLNQSQYGGEIEVDTDTLTKLIAAGADIQIL